MKLLYLLLIIPVIPFRVWGQQKRDFQLKDSATSSPVAYATIALFTRQHPEKPVQQLISKDNGAFTVTIADTIQYELQITHTAYNELRLPLTSQLSSTLLLIPAGATGSNVTVTGTRKVLVEKAEDKLIYNVENDLTMDGQTAADALRKAPFVSVDGDGNVQLKGQSNYKILVNGKESGLFSKNPQETLKSFPASAIKKIEVITNPSAKYDAEGVGGVINIITKKPVTGYNASVTANVGNLRRNEFVSLNIKMGKLGFTGYLNDGRGHNNNFRNYSLTQALTPSTYSKRTLDGTGSNHYQWQSGYAELSYDIDSLHTVSMYGSAETNPFGRNQTKNISLISPDYADTTLSVYRETLDNTAFYNEQGMDYIHKFAGKPNKEWTIKLNRTWSDEAAKTASDQYSSTSTYFSRNNNTEKNTQYVIQSDFVLPLSKGQKLETGVKTILRSANADYQSLYNYGGDKFIENEANTDHFRYRQSIVGGYFTYLLPLGKYNLKVGSRLEHTSVTGIFKSATDDLKQDYFNYIPTLYLSRKFNDKHDLSISYSKRLRRPYIWDLNPFVNNTDSLNISYGNPSLKPEITHSIELSYAYFKNSNSVAVTLSQNICNNQIIRYTLFDAATGITALTPGNYGENRFTALSVNLNLKFFKIWQVNLNSGLQYNKVKNKYNPEQHNQGFSGNGNLTNTIDISKKWSLFNSAGFYQGLVQLQGTLPFNYWYDAGVSYKLFDNKLRISLRGVSFLTRYMNYTRKYVDVDFMQETINRYQQRNVMLSVKWNFGKLSENTSRKRGVKTDDIQK